MDGAASTSSDSAMSEKFYEQKFESLEDLPQSLEAETKFALCAYVATILRLDFMDDWEEDFCSSTLNLIFDHLRLPSDRNDGSSSCSPSLKAVDHVIKSSEDLVVLVQRIRQDPFLVENGLLTLIADLITLFLKTGRYDARHRILLRHVCIFLSVSWDDVEACEQSVVHMLETLRAEETGEDVASRNKRNRTKTIKRYLMIGAGSAVGGVLIGLTGGLAAPIFAGGVAMLAGSAAAAGIASTAGVAVIGSVFGVAGAGLAGYKMNRRVGAVEEFQIETLSSGRSLHLCLAIPGWICEEREDSFRWAFRNMASSTEQYCLRYESKYLLQLGQAFDYLMTFAVSYAIQQTLMETALAGLVSALAWPLSILTVGSVVDNPWSVGVRRASEVGEHLAHVLLSRQHGNRPVTLIGFSLGARVVYHCLLEMAKHPQKAVGMIDDVVLLGAPVTGSPSEWKKVGKVVSGRIINGYCSTDWLLKFLYRAMNIQFTIAGTGPVVTGCAKVVNVNLSHIVQGHNDYQHKMTDILKAIGIKVKLETKSSSSFHDLASCGVKSFDKVDSSLDVLADSVDITNE